jgi:hypothetical protein
MKIKSSMPHILSHEEVEDLLDEAFLPKWKIKIKLYLKKIKEHLYKL